MAFTAAELKAIASLDNKQFQLGIAQMRDSVGKFTSGSLKDVGKMIGGAFAVGAVMNFGKVLMQEAAANERFARSVGISAGMLDELGDKAAETGADAEGFKGKIVKLVDSQEKAVTGDSKMVEAFKKLGVSMDDLTSKTPDELLLAVAKGAEKDATAIHNLNEVMGKGAAGEYGATLKDIAKNGLPAVSAAVDDSIAKFAMLHKNFEILKDSIGHTFMEYASTAMNKLMGLSDSDVENEKWAADQDRRKKNQERLAELRRQHQEAVALVKSEGQQKENEVIKRRDKAIEAITVSAPKAADSMAAYGRSIGGQGATTGIEERQLKELEIIAKTTEELADIQKDTNKKLAELGGE